MKKFIKEFKAFISRGNVMDMAVGVIVASAFTAIITALTNNILKPLINWIISLIVGGDGGLTAYTILKPGYVNGELDLASSIYIDWGAFISAIINFLLVALILFIILKAFNAAKSGAEKGKEVAKLRKEAIIKYKGQGLSRKAAIAKYEEELAEEKAKAEAEAKAKAEEEANKLSRTEQLLTDIKALLEEKK